MKSGQALKPATTLAPPKRGTISAEGLAALAAQVHADLECIEYPPRAWVPPRLGPDGQPVHDVVVVGAGLSGLSIAFGLMRRRVSNILVIDRAAKGKEGPWVTHALMDTLRSPKTLTGLDFGLPSLTYRAFHVAAYGEASWRALDKIDRRDWMAYLAWYREVLGLPVQNRTELVGIGNEGDFLRLDAATAEGPKALHARKVVLATGIDGAGRPFIPSAVTALPRPLWHHNAEKFDGKELAGKRVAVIGAGSSGFDCAVHALRNGAAGVVLYARRASLPDVEVLAWSNFPGFLTSFADLPDAERWRFMRRMRALVAPPTQEMFDKAVTDPRFEMRLGTEIDAISAEGDTVLVTASGRTGRFDHLLAATGFVTEIGARPELAPFCGRVALWKDRFTPPKGEEDEALAIHPYLGTGFELQAADHGDADFLGRIHLFNTGALPSLGPVCNGVTGLKYGVPRIVDAIARDLFLEDAPMHFEKLKGYAEPMFDGSTGRIEALKEGLATPAGPERAKARAAADRLIAATREMSAEFPVVLANHLPMVLEALYRLGASAERLEAYFEGYNRIHAVPPLGPSIALVGREDWRSALGDRSRERDLRSFFMEEARRLGGPGAIRIYVPQLAPGVAASALHGLMRLAYGVIRGDDAEIGIALGYWAATYLPLRDEPAGAPVTDDPAELALYMRTQLEFMDVSIDAHLLWHWIRDVGNRDAFAPVIGRLAMRSDTLDRIRGVSAALYASTMSFEALHAVTGSHWVRVVAAHMDDPAPLIRHFWQAILAVYPKIGCPLPASEEEMAALRALTPPPDAETAAAAVASDDEHDHSLTFSAFQEFARTGDPIYRVLAAKRMQLL